MSQVMYELAEYEFLLEQFQEAGEHFQMASTLLHQHQQLVHRNAEHHIDELEPALNQWYAHAQRLVCLRVMIDTHNTLSTIDEDRLIGYKVACQLANQANTNDLDDGTSAAIVDHILSVYQLERARARFDVTAIEHLLLAHSIRGSDSPITPAHCASLVRNLSSRTDNNSSNAPSLVDEQQHRDEALERIIGCCVIGDALHPNSEQRWIRHLNTDSTHVVQQLFEQLRKCYTLLGDERSKLDNQMTEADSCTAVQQVQARIQALDQWVVQFCSTINRRECWALFTELQDCLGQCNALPQDDHHKRSLLSVDISSISDWHLQDRLQQARAKRALSSANSTNISGDGSTMHANKRSRTERTSTTPPQTSTEFRNVLQGIETLDCNITSTDPRLKAIVDAAQALILRGVAPTLSELVCGKRERERHAVF
jgi:hypothetical protein